MTKEDPKALIGKFNLFKVVSVIENGAFLNREKGMPKDLFVPQQQQQREMHPGDVVVAYVFEDKRSGRLTASTRIDDFIDEARIDVAVEEEVDLLIYEKTDLGFKAIINNTAGGLLYKMEVFQPLTYAMQIKGYVTKIRDDGKIDLNLQKPRYIATGDLSAKVLSYLKSVGGSCTLTDKTPPEEIYKLFGISKKKFKMVCGYLYKERKIVIDNKGMQLVK